MAKRKNRPSEGLSDDTGNPQQFRLVDLFALTTLVALASAMVAPILRGIESDYRNRFLAIIGLQLIITAGTIVFHARKRKKLLEKTGPKIGVAFCGHFRWRYWPILRMFFTISIAMIFQMIIAVAMAIDFVEYGQLLHGPINGMIDLLPVSHRVLHYLHYFSFLDYLLYAQTSMFAGYAFSLYRWRAYPNSMEFFEYGIVKKGTLFTPWKRIEVRPSAFFPDKIAIIVRSSQLAIEDHASPECVDSKNHIAGSTIMAQVLGELRERVFAAANSAHEENRNDRVTQ